jgi:LmbE family N-acetylglucosaminyl deacetylase
MKNILIISAHADDEALGMGGTLSLLSKGGINNLYWLIATKIWNPKWSMDAIKSREIAIENMNKMHRFKEIIRWDFGDNMLDREPINDIQEKMIEVIDRIKPNIIFTPSFWDFNHEHKLIFDIVEMSSKSFYSPYIEEILTYEIPSSTDAAFMTVKNFPSNVYYNIETTIDEKIKQINFYTTEIKAFPHPRSEEYIRALAKVRGVESGVKYAESFVLLRGIRK